MSGDRRLAWSIALAALAAGALPATLMLGAGRLGTGAALALHLLGTAAGAAAVSASRWRGSVGRALGVLLVGCAALAIVPDATGRGLVALAVLLAGVLAAQRALLHAGRRRVRRLVVEGLLLIAGLALAGFLVGPSPISWAFALWGFLLIHALHPLFMGAPRPRRGPSGTDPFEAARHRLEQLLEQA